MTTPFVVRKQVDDLDHPEEAPRSPDRRIRAGGGSAEVLADEPPGLTLNQPTDLASCGEALANPVVADLGGWHISTARVTARSGPVEFPALI